MGAQETGGRERGRGVPRRSGPAAGLRYSVVPGRWAVARLEPGVGAGTPLLLPFHSVTRTAAELSVVCPEEAVPPGARAEPGWALLSLEGPFPFDQVGVLVAFLAPLAEAGIGVFALSTFDTDHVLVKHDRLGEALAALAAAGHELAGPAPDARPAG